MARRAVEMEAAAEERASKPVTPKSNLLRAVAMVTLVGAIVSISPYLFFHAQERVQNAGKQFNQLTETRASGDAVALANKAQATLSIGKAQRTATLDAAIATGTDLDLGSQTSLSQKSHGVSHFPKPVADWVGILRSYEEERTTLALSQLKTASGDNVPDKAALADQFQDQWIQLVERFEKEDTPNECQDLAAAYGRTLRETAKAVIDKVRTTSAVSTVSVGQQALESVLVPPAQDADQLLKELCSKFGSSKDFGIEAQLKAPKQP